MEHSLPAGADPLEDQYHGLLAAQAKRSLDQVADYGVEPICRVLTRAGVQIAPSTYCAAKSRSPSARTVRDVELVEQIHRVHGENYAVYGARKVYAELNRQDIRVLGARLSD
ncbi:IS3 family transposase [Rhodococcus sp. NPDC056960]|uniref:IS3 family transposase n=1 Tax=Rhodococcus sp. NPDC056960 TaxID=3345982 RepID=UPI003645B348